MELEVIPLDEWPLWQPSVAIAIADVRDGSSCAQAAVSQIRHCPTIEYAVSALLLGFQVIVTYE